MRTFMRPWFVAICAAALCGVLPAAARAGTGELTIIVVDRDTGEQIPCRMHLKNQYGVSRTVPGLPFWKDHFALPGTIELKLNTGTYTFLIERGPEYVDVRGHFTITDHAKDEKVIELKRAVNMADENWWSGELHIHRPLRDIELAMRAEDLHVAPVITWWNKKNQWADGNVPTETVVQFDENRYYDIMAGEDERGGGAMLFFGLDRPLEISEAEREYPSAIEFLMAARERNANVWVDAEKPFWWDVPIWLATGQINSIGLAHNHLHREGMLHGEAWGRPHDKQAYRTPLATALWSQDIYYHVLNCGLRIPPSAGSASGVMPNPIGYNRVYVWVDKDRFNYQTWWEAYRQGRVVVTNGPLIRPFANGRLPGHVFHGSAGDTLAIDLTMNLTTRDPITYLEVVYNGRVLRSVRLDEWARQGGRFPELKFDKSGWFLVRAVTDLENTYRFTSSGPWYVEIGDEPQHISRRSAQFFVDWVEERAGKIKLADDEQQQAVMQHVEHAQEFWNDVLSRANAE